MNRWYVGAVMEALSGSACLLIPGHFPFVFFMAGACFGVAVTMLLNGINNYD
jgi:hypothetical protein